MNQSHFNIENQRDIIERLSLPDDVFDRRIILITDSSDDDSEDNLVCLHYNQQKLPELTSGALGYTIEEVFTILTVRGVIFDLDSKKIVCMSYPFTKVLQMNSTDKLDECLSSLYKEENLYPHGEFKECFSGALYRVYKHNGKVYASTHKKINASKSHFGRSRNFGDIFLKDQELFESLEDIYQNCDDDDIHIFLLNDEDLLIDTRDVHTEDRVIHLKTFSLENPEKDCSYFPEFIKSYNANLYGSDSNMKLIHFTNPLSKEEVKNMLDGDFGKGTPSIDFNAPANVNFQYLQSVGADALRLFSNGRRVIYQDPAHIYTLASPNIIFRQQLINGVANPAKLFFDCYANYGKPTFEKILVPFGFTVSVLREIQQKIRDKQPFDIFSYERHTEYVDLIVLTNLFFSLPLHLIDELFDIFANYPKMCIDATNFFIHNKERLGKLITDKKLVEFEGMHSISKKMKTFLETRFTKCFTPNGRKGIDCGINDKWPTSLKEYYLSLCANAEKSKNNSDLTNTAICCLINNADDEILYSLVRMKSKHEATLNARRRTAEKKQA